MHANGSDETLVVFCRRVVVRGPWPALANGVVLVDAPGMHDDDSARDRVVKAALSSADAIILVSNVRRAVNDKTVKDALPLTVRRTLATTGRLGDIMFVATQNDTLNRSEVAAPFFSSYRPHFAVEVATTSSFQTFWGSCRHHFS